MNSETEHDTRPHSRPPLRRPAHGRMVAGVAAGLGRHFGIDPNIFRVVFVVLGLLAIIGSGLGVAGIPFWLAGIPLYLACWLLIPEEGEDHSIAGHMLDSLQSRSR